MDIKEAVEIVEELKLHGISVVKESRRYTWSQVKQALQTLIDGVKVDEGKIEKLKQEYATQDNRATAYPIYVSVQELHCIGVMADGYSPNCPYGDGETKKRYIHYDLEGDYDSVHEIREALSEDFEGNELEEKMGNEEEINLGYIWTPVEFFLTIKGAEEYMKANKHNHGKLRTYVHHFERRNFEMRELLEVMGFSQSK